MSTLSSSRITVAFPRLGLPSIQCITLMIVWMPTLLSLELKDSQTSLRGKRKTVLSRWLWTTRELFSTATAPSTSQMNTDVFCFTASLLTLAYVYHFNQEGTLIDAFAPPEAFIPMRNGTESFSANSPPRFDPTDFAIPANPKTGRQNNQGFEGMTVTPDGKLLYVLLQSSTIQDGGTASTRRNTRLLERDLKKKEWMGEWVVQLPTYNDSGTKVAAQSEMHYLNKDQFFVLARDSSRGYGMPNSTSLYRHVSPHAKRKIDGRLIFSISPMRRTLSVRNTTTDPILSLPMGLSWRELLQRNTSRSSTSIIT